mmetsp:Transcript_18332/g.53511  ORF Transcript_18332/g.53511 Transcript_18332/m.53511 type:complete len:207 (+) Transcript_18332:497-1117(+)
MGTAFLVLRHDAHVFLRQVAVVERVRRKATWPLAERVWVGAAKDALLLVRAHALPPFIAELEDGAAQDARCVGTPPQGSTFDLSPDGQHGVLLACIVFPGEHHVERVVPKLAEEHRAIGEASIPGKEIGAERGAIIHLQAPSVESVIHVQAARLCLVRADPFRCRCHGEGHADRGDGRAPCFGVVHAQDADELVHEGEELVAVRSV